MVVLSSQLDPIRGRLMDREQRRRLAEVLERHQMWVLENDSHGALCFEPQGTPMRDLIDPQRLLILGAFDKVIGLEAPFGYLLSRHSRELWHRQLLLRSFRLPPIRQKAIARLYSSGQMNKHLENLRLSLQERVVDLSIMVDQYLGDEVRFEAPQGGATLWLESVHRVDMGRVFNRLLEQRIVIAPGELFSAQGLHQQSMRISGAADWNHDIASALITIRGALAQERVG